MRDEEKKPRFDGNNAHLIRDVCDDSHIYPAKMRFDDYVNGKMFPSPIKQEMSNVGDPSVFTDKEKVFLSFLEECKRDREKWLKEERKSMHRLAVVYAFIIIAFVVIPILDMMKK